MTPTLTLIQTADTDDLTFECDHAVTAVRVINSTTLATVNAAVDELALRHRTTCSCQPEVVDFIWPSMSEALQVFEKDALSPAPNGATGVVHAANLDVLRRRQCWSCDPVLLITLRAGHERVYVDHAVDCRNDDRPPPRTSVVALDEARA